MSSLAAEPWVRRIPVGISAEVVLEQWARQDAAPPGAAVVVDVEIAARRRGGVEWRVADALAVAVLARPTSIGPADAGLGWVAAGLGAARAFDDLFDGPHHSVWPDGVSGPRLGAEVAVAARSALGPGRIDHVALVARSGPWPATTTRDRLAAALVERLREAAAGLDDPGTLCDDYRARCAFLDEHIEIDLLPHGSVRGRMLTVDASGAVVVVSSTGLRERVTVEAVAHLRPVPRPHD